MALSPNERELWLTDYYASTFPAAGRCLVAGLSPVVFLVPWPPMHVLVTGGSGYIGQGLVRSLAARSDVTAITNVDIREPTDTIAKVRFVPRSVTEDLDDLFTSDPPVAVAVHLAWTVDPLRDSRRQTEICLGGTKRFLDGCAAAGTGKLLFASSGTAYGAHPDHAVPVAEDEPLKPRWHMQYSREKQQAEAMVADHGREHPNVITQIARPCVVGGPHVDNFIFRSLRKPLVARPAGYDPEVQLVHEDDCAAALAAILATDLAGAFNIAADGCLRLSELYRRTGVRAPALPSWLLKSLATTLWHLRLHGLNESPPGFVDFLKHPWLMSNRRLKEEVGFRFRYDAEATLETYLAARAA